MGNQATSRIISEVAQFDAVGGEWWDEHGPFKPLHLLNPVRMGYVILQIKEHLFSPVIPAKAGIHGADLSNDIGLKLCSLDSRFRGNDGVLEDLKILDIACGGGLVCEPLARLGAQVTGIDTSANAIAAARAHAAAQDLDIDYQCCALEEFSPRQKFDVITALEILEHVADPAAFVKSAVRLLKPGGLIIFSTINRTAKSLLLAKIAAEDILKIIPRGTHDWNQFIQPSELAEACEAADLTVKNMIGLKVNPIRAGAAIFALSNDVSVNYFLTATH